MAGEWIAAVTDRHPMVHGVGDDVSPAHSLASLAERVGAQVSPAEPLPVGGVVGEAAHCSGPSSAMTWKPLSVPASFVARDLETPW